MELYYIEEHQHYDCSVVVGIYEDETDAEEALAVLKAKNDSFTSYHLHTTTTIPKKEQRMKPDT
jgi:urate oxidase